MGFALQTQDSTLLLEGVNAYRRAIQYQQLEKLQHSGNGAQGFYVQVSLATWSMLAASAFDRGWEGGTERGVHGGGGLGKGGKSRC